MTQYQAASKLPLARHKRRQGNGRTDPAANIAKLVTLLLMALQATLFDNKRRIILR